MRNDRQSAVSLVQAQPPAAVTESPFTLAVKEVKTSSVEITWPAAPADCNVDAHVIECVEGAMMHRVALCAHLCLAMWTSGILFKGSRIKSKAPAPSPASSSAVATATRPVDSSRLPQLSATCESRPHT